jgi:hypothetical protein
MSTINQEKAALRVKEAIERKELTTGGEILESIGYSKAIAKNPQMVFESKGFKEALERLGFSIEAADLTVAKVLRTGKDENKLRAAAEVYKRFGAYSPEKHEHKVLSISKVLDELETDERPEA